MMTREQRIEYEILDCVLHRSTHSLGYSSTTTIFTERLRKYFPDIDIREFPEACRRLVLRNALDVEPANSHDAPVKLRDRRGVIDNDIFSGLLKGQFYLRSAKQ